MPGPVLLVAAEAREFSGLLRRCRRVKRLDWPLCFAARAECNGAEWILAANGPGAELAKSCVTVAAGRMKFACLVSTGYCGALAPWLQVGDVFLASAVGSSSAEVEIFALPPRTSGTAREGRLLSLPRVVNSLAEREAWCARGYAAVEMEALAVGKEAARRRVPFYCVRVVTDTATQAFLMDFNALRDAQGRFSRGRIVLEALKHPVVRIPFLFALHRRLNQASERLGEFLATCRFE